MPSYKLPRGFQKYHEVSKSAYSKPGTFQETLPKGQRPKIRGSICNVPNGPTDISNTLPRQVDSNGPAIVKLKGKREYKGHIYSESVLPYVINQL